MGTPTRRAVLKGTAALAGLAAVQASGLASAAEAAPADTSSGHPKANVLLVHGAWVDGSSWTKVIAILQQSIPRHLRYVAALGVTERLAAELPVGIPVVELSDEKKTFGRMVEVGKTLRHQHGADVVVMGCAGMARYRKPLQDEIGVPVVEPTQAAVAMAIGRVRLNWAGS